MKNKLKLCIFLLFSSFATSYGQSELNYTSGISSLLTWISDLDNLLVKITDKEKLKQIDRQLGFLSNDLSDISFKKETLYLRLLAIKDTNDDEKKTNLTPLVYEINAKVEDLIKRLRSIKGILSQTNQVEIDNVITQLSSNYRNKKLSHLDNIKHYVSLSTNAPLSKIQMDAQISKGITEKAISKINEAKVKIKAQIDGTMSNKPKGH